MSGAFISNGPRQADPVSYLNGLFELAARENYSDIHLQRGEKESRVKFRYPGGAIFVHEIISNDWMMVIDEKIRAKAQVSTTDHRAPQDGRISLTFENLAIDVRIAITPGVGECQLIVCRVLNQSKASIQLAGIEMPFMVREALRRVVEEPHGLFIVCGPTGSGKTTTLYALLNELNDGTRNIVTIENPVEYRIADFHQINVDGVAMTYPSALRTVLRQDPDVIMVGEIRDFETANIAVQAAMTGHLVISTIHANNAALAITRLIDLKVDAASLNGALRGVVAQRLVRTIRMDAEVEKVKVNEVESAWLKLNGINRYEAVEYVRLRDPAKGYNGVVPVMEVILADWRVRKAITKGESAIYMEASRQAQFETIAQAGERLAYTGRTTLDEVRHLTSGQDSVNIQNKRLGQVLVEQQILSQEAIDDILAQQAMLKKAGEHKRLGRLLIDGSLCTKDEVYKAVGFTAEARDVLLRICRTDETREKAFVLIAKWTQGHASLFDMVISSGLATEKEVYDAYDC